MENNIVDCVSQLKVRNAAKNFYSISKDHPQDESINLIYSGMVSFLEGIRIPEPEILDKDEVKKSLTILDIERIVCEYYRMNPEKLYERTRKKEVALCRHMVFYFAFEFNICSTTSIGRHYGVHHTSVIHGKSRISDLADVEEKTRLDIENIKYNIKRILLKPD